jgi:hypothetical protein
MKNNKYLKHVEKDETGQTCQAYPPFFCHISAYKTAQQGEGGGNYKKYNKNKKTKKQSILQ